MSATPPAVEDILRSAHALHGAGTLSPAALSQLAGLAARQNIEHSAETGCGASTLLLSHLSRQHTAFALDIGGSVANVRSSPLLRPGVVTFVDGPSQTTLADYRFDGGLDLVLIDGPHAYPFPDLEYYRLYPHLNPGALFVLDDIHIPTIQNLYRFVRADAMFEQVECVRSTAFFRRTDAPVFDPLGDGWQQQAFNRQTLLRYDWRSRLRRILFAAAAWRRRDHDGEALRIHSPAPGAAVGDSAVVRGTVDRAPSAALWLLVRRSDAGGWWPQGGGRVEVQGTRWEATVRFGEPSDAGHRFEITAALVSEEVDRRWNNWVKAAEETGTWPPVQLPSPPDLIDAALRTVVRQQ
jgi:predicted O-methyltransferase YrrM